MGGAIFSDLIAKYSQTTFSKQAAQAMEKVLIDEAIIRADTHLGKTDLRKSLSNRIKNNENKLSESGVQQAFSATYAIMKENYERESQKLDRRLRLSLYLLLILIGVGLLLSILTSNVFLSIIPTIFALVISGFSVFIYHKEHGRLSIMQRDISDLQFYRAQIEMLQSIPEGQLKEAQYQLLSNNIAEGRAQKTVINNYGAVKNQVNISENHGEVGNN